MKTLLLSLLCKFISVWLSVILSWSDDLNDLFSVSSGLFVWNQSTEALTDQQVVLGQSVTLACEFRLKDVIWFVMKLPARPEMILRTLGAPKQAKYYNKFISKYSKGGLSRLLINEVSVDDLGIYYCIKPGWDLEVSDGIRLHTGKWETAIHLYN